MIVSKESVQAEMELNRQDTECLLRALIRSKRNLNLGFRFLEYNAYIHKVSPEHMYRKVFGHELPTRLRKYLRGDNPW